MSIEDTLKKYTGSWMEIPGVVGTGLGACQGKPCIKIYVSEMTSALRQQIPESVDGHSIIIEETGNFMAFS